MAVKVLLVLGVVLVLGMRSEARRVAENVIEDSGLAKEERWDKVPGFMERMVQALADSEIITKEELRAYRRQARDK